MQQVAVPKNSISSRIKKMCHLHGQVKCRVKSMSRTSVYVTFLTVPDQALVDKITAELDTCQAHGDTMNDTRYYTGTSIDFRYKAPVSDEMVNKYKEIKAKFNPMDFNSMYHFRKELEFKFGYPMARNLLDNY